MPNDQSRLKDKSLPLSSEHWSLDIGHSLVIGHSLDIGHWTLVIRDHDGLAAASHVLRFRRHNIRRAIRARQHFIGFIITDEPLRGRVHLQRHPERDFIFVNIDTVGGEML